ncbi:glycoside hydrolase family 3 C-terminal domain-containing protein, partial [Aduncisulcus paluster]
PSYGNFPGDKIDVVYSEGILTGYRYYDTKKLPVQYPFGHGMSYTSFSYADLEFDEGQNTLSLKVRNTGMFPRQEVVQVYIRDVKSYGFRPDKELKGYAKIYLQPNEEKQVKIKLHDRAFAYYLTHMKGFAVEAGAFDILVGASSRDIRLKKRIHIDSDVDVRPLPTMEDTVNDWLEDDRTKGKMTSLLNQMGIDEYSPYYGLMIGMPMSKVLWFFK